MSRPMQRGWNRLHSSLQFFRENNNSDDAGRTLKDEDEDEKKANDRYSRTGSLVVVVLDFMMRVWEKKRRTDEKNKL